jgi:hypothetical protein
MRARDAVPVQKIHPRAAQTARVRKIERRLRARLAAIFPGVDAKALVIELRPLIREAARDGLADHDAIWRRMAAAPLFKQIAARLTEALADRA